MTCIMCRDLMESGRDFFRCPKCGRAYLLNNSRFYEGEIDINKKGQFIFRAEENIIGLSSEEWIGLTKFSSREKVKQEEGI